MEVDWDDVGKRFWCGVVGWFYFIIIALIATGGFTKMNEPYETTILGGLVFVPIIFGWVGVCIVWSIRW